VEHWFFNTLAENQNMALQIDLTQATLFLRILEPIEGQKHIFQTFDDQPEKNPEKVRVFSGTFKGYKQKLIDKNKESAGVFVLINQSSTNRRLKEDICRVRAVWQEDDAKGSGRIPELTPSLVVETSPNKYHRYWLIQGGSTDLASWSEIQQKLVADWESDPNVKDVSRVLRLPGFCHMKNKNTPFTSKIVSDPKDVKRYTIEELYKYFVGDKPEKKQAPSYNGTDEESFDPIKAINEIIQSENFHGAQVSLALHYANLGLGKEETKAVLNAFFKQASPQDARWQARYKEIHSAVDSAFKKVGQEEKHNGFTHTPEINIKDSNRDTFLNLDFPEEKLNLHSFAKNVMEHMRYPSYEIAIETVLHVTSVLAGNFYTYEGTPNHRKTILLAGQGRGKDIMKIYFEEILGALSAQHKQSQAFYFFIGAGDYTSPKQLHAELQEFGSRSMISSEAGHAQNNKTGDVNALTGYVNQVLASQPSALILPRKQQHIKSETKLKPLRSVCMNILHESVPNNYARLLADREQFIDGGLSRTSFVFIDPKIDEENINIQSNEASIDPESLKVFDIIARAHIEHGDPANLTQRRPATLEVKSTDKVKQLFFDLEKESIIRKNRSQSEIEESLYARRAVRIKQTARLLAILDNPVRPEIEMKHARWAVYRHNTLDECLLANVSHGVLAHVLITATEKLYLWVREYLKGNKKAQPTRFEKEHNFVMHGSLTTFWNSNAKLLAELKELPEYRYRQPREVKKALYDEAVDLGFFKVSQKYKARNGTTSYIVNMNCDLSIK
jgi:hypothetical protein